ncbi:MAG: epoxyqueuosine reductase [Firmicutes bacterium]|nr:epoxyqueuosine reductase [Bacillota bacterium]
METRSADEVKKKIKDFALGMGVDDVGFATVSDYQSPRSPSIESLFPAARSMVVLTYKELSNCESPSPQMSMAGRLDIMEFARSCNYKLCRFLEKEFRCTAMSTPLSYPLDMGKKAGNGTIGDVSCRHAALAAGQGNFGRNNLIIHPTLGARVIFAVILTSLELPSDPPVTEDLCIQCNICVENCPAGALDEEGKTDVLKCLGKSQPYGIMASISFWRKFIDSPPEEQKKMFRDENYLRLYQSAFIGFQYHCFNCYMLCPIGQD